MNCKNCNKETKNKYFCSNSCAAKCNNNLRISKCKFYKCMHCNKECKVTSSKSNLYCSNACQGEFKFQNETKTLVAEGKINDPKTLKRYLLKTRDCKCELCSIGDTWNGLPLILQLDHIDGNSDNNFPSNLRLLCPNCHSQTDTFAGKKREKKQTKRNSYLRKFKGYEE